MCVCLLVSPMSNRRKKRRLGHLYTVVKEKTVFIHLGGSLSAYGGLFVYGETQQSIIDVQWLALAYFAIEATSHTLYRECRKRRRFEVGHFNLATLEACST